MENNLLDSIKKEFHIKNDCKLADFIGISRPEISKIRHATIEISPRITLLIHKKTNWPVTKIEELSIPFSKKEMIQRKIEILQKELEEA